MTKEQFSKLEVVGSKVTVAESGLTLTRKSLRSGNLVPIL
jgi:hypothetical protein